MRTALFLAAVAAAALAPHNARAQARFGVDPQELAATGPQPMRVLWIGAHPDDEDTNLIAWLARGRNVETAYLSLTRGDGGQNLIGNELGEALGVIRTEELLAARRLDGAHQYFARGYDFGFSKTADETRRHWPQDSLLNDVITVMRAFRPQIVITTFSGTPRDGHGQHQISAIVAREAYNAAADTLRFPVSKFGPAWTPLKFYRLARFSPQDRTIAINVGEYDPNLGLSYQEIAADSRSQHKSQGEGTLRRKGVVWDYLSREDSRVPAPPAKEEKSIFAGLDTVNAYLVREGRIGARDSLVPIELEAVADRQALALGDSAKISFAIFNRGKVPIQVPGVAGAASATVVMPDSSYRWTQWYVGRELTQPWWLAQPRNGDLFTPRIDGVSEDARERRNWAHVSVGVQGRSVDIASPIVFHYVDRVRGDVQRPLIVAPGISITLEEALTMARANAPFNRIMKATLRSALADSAATTVSLSLPKGLVADSNARTLIMAPGATRTLTFRITGRLPRGSHVIAATANARGVGYASGYIPIEYPHINPERIYRPSTLTVNAVDVALPARMNVAYVQGVGDNIPPVLRQLGIPVTIIEPDDIPQADLSRFTAIVVGPRAYQASQTLIDNNDYLLGYARNGGRLVVQYGQAEMMRPGVMPYPIQLKQPAERVTVEEAPVTITDPNSPLLNSPNRITQEDFAGWVQERATYMPSTFDGHYRTMLSMNDPGEQPNKAAILVTPYGRGVYIYVPLALFRQLPAGVPGAARIFANLIGGNTIR